MQQHLSEEQLVELYYAPPQERAAAEAHLAECKMCDGDYRQLQDVLSMVSAAPIPERDENYGRDVYLRLLPQISEAEQRGNWRNMFRGWHWATNWGTAAVMALLMVMAFGAGRFWPYKFAGRADQQAAGQVRERVLLVALGDHLDRSQMVLMELSHVPVQPGAATDITTQQQFAEDLLADNRLYRQTAAQAGEANVASVLEELERMLMEIANSPSHLRGRELEELQKRLADKDILFKIEVIGSSVREREKTSQVATAGKGKV